VATGVTRAGGVHTAFGRIKDWFVGNAGEQMKHMRIIWVRPARCNIPAQTAYITDHLFSALSDFGFHD
jgi:hypothetical protein